MEKIYVNKHWSFIKQSNSGLGKTRNVAASKAKGRYLVFMDSDNVAKSDMLEKMVKAIMLSDIDCLT
ncbi:glycosyltransferase family A protein, partial [Brachyspira hyodysenteriae]|uniref:glycosyltransferase family A protein n=1 Tax=Brachyspira hyodysenteriae TaxID=159 RepID=UPI001F4E6ED9